tara:strand:- start:226 stop:435 length:210 start_codon:yes stop_codon:yes gene_type:complete
MFKPEIINAYESTKDAINEEFVNGSTTLEELQFTLSELSKVDIDNLPLDIDKYMHNAMKQILQEVTENN